MQIGGMILPDPESPPSPPGHFMPMGDLIPLDPGKHAIHLVRASLPPLGDLPFSPVWRIHLRPFRGICFLLPPALRDLMFFNISGSSPGRGSSISCGLETAMAI